MPPAKTETEPRVVRDVRVDQIGFADQLRKLHVDDLRTDVKAALMDKDAELVAGDHFVGVLVTGNEKSIDPTKYFRLIKKGQITEKQFLASVRVVIAEANRVLSKDAVAKLATITPASPRLVITQKEGVEVSLLDALKGLCSAVEAKSE